MTQLALLLGRPLRMPADDDGSYDNEATVYEQIDVYLSPRQATWIGLDAPTVPQCPGCVLFGCCALHDDDETTGDDKKHEGRRLQPTALADATPRTTKR